MTRGYSDVYEKEYRHRDGHVFPVELRTYLSRDETGKPQGYWAIVRDVSDRKRVETERVELERRLLHTQKLESLGVLAGGIAHDFNNLLMAVLGNLDMAVIDLPPASPVRDTIEQAIQAARRATDLTRQMLAYSGRGHFVVTRVDVSELVRENAGLFRTAIPRTTTMNLNLSNEAAFIEGDPGQIQQIIMNLITNAADAIGDRAGSITLSTRVQFCDAAYLKTSRTEEKPQPGTFVCLQVSDTGCGMERETLDRLFDPFFTTKFAGRGLGMSAVLGIVRGHRGAICVDSAIGKGTTISVLFPAGTTHGARSAPDRAHPALSSQATTESGSILVVDDEATVRSVGAAFVQRLGFGVVTAADGQEALRVFQQHARNLVAVLLDLTMPGLDGVGAFRELKRIRPDIPVILCSGYSEQDAAQELKEEGLAGFIQKPYGLHDLKTVLEQAIGGSKPTST